MLAEDVVVAQQNILPSPSPFPQGLVEVDGFIATVSALEQQEDADYKSKKAQFQSNLLSIDKIEKYAAIRHICFECLKFIYQQEFIHSELFEKLYTDLQYSVIEIRLLRAA